MENSLSEIGLISGEVYSEFGKGAEVDEFRGSGRRSGACRGGLIRLPLLEGGL